MKTPVCNKFLCIYRGFLCVNVFGQQRLCEKTTTRVSMQAPECKSVMRVCVCVCKNFVNVSVFKMFSV